MNFKRTIALILAAMLVVVGLASCANTSDKDSDKSSDDQYITEGDYQFTKYDFNGEDFTTLSVAPGTDGGLGYYNGDYIDADSITGEVTNDAVYDRNVQVEEAYNVVMGTIYIDEDDITDTIRQYTMAGDISFDNIYAWGIRVASLIPDNYYYDFNQIPYVDLTRDYWCPTAMDDLTVAGKTYVVSNDITMNKLAWSTFLYFNKQVIEDYNLDDPQDYVASDEWTLDNFYTLVQSVHSDLDGDNAFTKEDQYGLIDQGLASNLVRSSGHPFTTKNDDGSYTLNLGTEEMMDSMASVKEVLSNSAYVFSHSDITQNADMGSLDEWAYVRSYFAEGHSLFMSGTAEITSELRDMEDSYGVVPMPKNDSYQTDYVSYIDPCACMFAVSSSPRDINKTGLIMEYEAYVSNQVLLPAYYEQTIKSQRMDTETDQEMLDIVRDSIRYDWTDLAFTTTYSTDEYNNEGNPISSTFQKMYDSGSPASMYERNKTRLNTIISDYYTTVAGLS